MPPRKASLVDMHKGTVDQTGEGCWASRHALPENPLSTDTPTEINATTWSMTAPDMSLHSLGSSPRSLSDTSIEGHHAHHPFLESSFTIHRPGSDDSWVNFHDMSKNLHSSFDPPMYQIQPDTSTQWETKLCWPYTNPINPITSLTPNGQPMQIYALPNMPTQSVPLPDHTQFQLQASTISPPQTQPDTTLSDPQSYPLSPASPSDSAQGTNPSITLSSPRDAERKYRRKLDKTMKELIYAVPTLRAVMDGSAHDRKTVVGNLVPANNCRKPTVLKKTVEYIRWLEAENAALRRGRGGWTG